MEDGEARLWWAVVRQAARDILWARDSVAEDAREFMNYTGVWLCRAMFRVPVGQTRKELKTLEAWRRAYYEE